MQRWDLRAMPLTAEKMSNEIILNKIEMYIKMEIFLKWALQNAIKYFIIIYKENISYDTFLIHLYINLR